jgi:hypothetical protein
MRIALQAVLNGNIGLNAAFPKYSVPKATLQTHLDGKNHFALENKGVIGCVGDIPPHVEEELVDLV